MQVLASLLFICFSLAFLQQKADPYAHASLLNYYQTAAKDEEIAEKFITLMNKYQGKDPLKLGYKAVSHAIMAKHVWSPYAKLKYLRQSSQFFEQAVALDKQDAEVRFLRFSIENYIPRYLNMSSHLEDDKRVFMDAILRHPRSGISAETIKIMRDFLLRKDLLTEQEQQQVAKLEL
ncbi:hypothetical protein [Rufibacter latericius]|uniref:Uncharacterized protein n=1 Tax=Rufibacter latericius TaxID=2487040 RepID=A0A3M9MVZ7_9BACT|nr:hypothetical protein [Rufibacter latericius]RNI29287.1 hypothetical protein EFB08_07655 [Rufibacter latericius]